MEKRTVKQFQENKIQDLLCSRRPHFSQLKRLLFKSAIVYVIQVERKWEKKMGEKQEMSLNISKSH